MLNEMLLVWWFVFDWMQNKCRTPAIIYRSGFLANILSRVRTVFCPLIDGFFGQFFFSLRFHAFLIPEQEELQLLPLRIEQQLEQKNGLVWSGTDGISGSTCSLARFFTSRDNHMRAKEDVVDIVTGMGLLTGTIWSIEAKVNNYIEFATIKKKLTS